MRYTRYVVLVIMLSSTYMPLMGQENAFTTDVTPPMGSRVRNTPKWLGKIGRGLKDWKVWVAIGAQVAADSWDVRTTNECQRRFPACYEKNILLGRHPSSARVWALNGAYLTALGLGEAYLSGSSKDKGVQALVFIPAALSTAKSIRSAKDNESNIQYFVKYPWAAH
jgi:hypothetical protein